MRLAAFACSVLVTCFAPRIAFAQRDANSIHILTFATKSQDRIAEAVTQALRADVKATPGWTVLDSPASLSLLMLGLKCPPAPDSACLVKISDQLKVSRFIWGTVDAGKSGAVVQAHLWENGKGDTSLEVALPETATEQAQTEVREAAHRIARRLVYREGTLLLKSNAPSGQVIVDGQEKAKLNGAPISVTLSEGTHDVVVKVGATVPVKRRVKINAGESATELFTFEPNVLRPKDSEPPDSGVDPKKGDGVAASTIFGIGLLVLGAGGAALGIEEFLRYRGHQERADELGKLNWGVPGPPVNDPCSLDGSRYPQAKEACSLDPKAKTASTLSVVGFSVGGVALVTGVVLLTLDHGRKSEKGAVFAPVLGPSTAGAEFKLRF